MVTSQQLSELQVLVAQREELEKTISARLGALMGTNGQATSIVNAPVSSITSVPTAAAAPVSAEPERLAEHRAPFVTTPPSRGLYVELPVVGRTILGVALPPRPAQEHESYTKAWPCQTTVPSGETETEHVPYMYYCLALIAARHGSLNVAKMAEKFGVSEQSIKATYAHMQRKGWATRIDDEKGNFIAFNVHLKPLPIGGNPEVVAK